MSNIIRPTFGQPRRPEPVSDDDRVEVTTQRVYGEAGDHRVCLVRDDDAPGGEVYKVVGRASLRTGSQHRGDPAGHGRGRSGC